jgi:DNA adenine methylase
MNKKLKPFFKWSGGKRRETEHVIDFLPDQYDTFYEPFLGGGAVWLELNPAKSIVGDFYDEVITFYKCLQDYGKGFVAEVNNLSDEYNNLIKTHYDSELATELGDKIDARKAILKKVNDLTTKEEFEIIKPLLDGEIKSLRKNARSQFDNAAAFYYKWRALKSQNDKDIAKRFFILRCLAYGGMLRFNSSGEFNVPYGYYKSFKKLPWSQEYSTIFKNTEFICDTWQQTLATATADDFVFLDPPYTREFKEYSSNNVFGNEAQIELADWFKSKKSKAMIIINKDEFTYDLYKDYIVKEYDFKYSVKYRDRFTDEDAKTKHMLAINYRRANES